MLLTLTMRILSALVSVYMILCALRVFMAWIPGMQLGRAGRFISAIVDPYLAFFSRLRAFRTERFDFSPIIALAVLSVVNNLFMTLAYSGRITVGYIFSLILSAAWSAVSFVLSFLGGCAVLRIIVHAARWNTFSPVWTILDSILNPVLYRINRLVYRNRAIPYIQGLVTGAAVFLVLRIGGGAIIRLLCSVLVSLPF